MRETHINVEEKAQVDGGEKVTHASESDVSSIVIIVVGIEEKVKAKGGALPHELGVLDDRVGHVIVPFG